MTAIEAADGITLHVTEWGEGPPIVFTHAWGLQSEQWTYQIPDLVGGGFRCITYDRRGHGRSDRAGSGYDVDTLADDLAAVIDHIGPIGVTLVGHSLGCKEIVRYLTRHGQDLVTLMVLVAPTTPFLLQTSDNPDGFPRAAIDASCASLRADIAKWCVDANDAGPYFGTSPASQGLVDWTVRHIVDTPLYVLLETQRLNIQTDLRGELPRIHVPTLVVHGDADSSAPLALTGKRTAALIPGAELVVYPGAGHGLYASDHDRLNADILRFIRSHAADPTALAA
jgi:pimeloyl-ACP methyl ester carboxylesterase